MKKEIVILCNSPQCLEIISGGHIPDLHQKNLFTCNLAYTHFRTSGRHLNIFVDTPIIDSFINRPQWYENYGCYNYDKVEFIINPWEHAIYGKHNYMQHKAKIKVSPVLIPASSAIAALFYLNAAENYDVIHLVGYTLREWSGLHNVKELQHKLKAFQDVTNKYEVFKNELMPTWYTYIKR